MPGEVVRDYFELEGLTPKGWDWVSWPHLPEGRACRKAELADE